MKLTKRPFGILPDGRAVTCWTLENDSGLQAEVLDYGVTIRAIRVPDRTGAPVDVVLGFDTLQDYLEDGDFVGATVGRFANRIGKGSFTLNGRTYQVPVNNGPNALHGGTKGFDQKLWAARELENGLEFTTISPDGEMGFPGTLQVRVQLTWEGNGLKLHYHAETDQDTILNLTNHSYFNLNGTGKIYTQKLTLQADSFTMNDENTLPTGEIVPVDGTPMDFRKERAFGDGVDSDELCVKISSGYDTNFCLTGNPAAVARSEETGIVMTMTTDQPGVQLYTANFKKERIGKNGEPYGKRSAFCLETQHYPDCVNHPQWPTCILRRGEAFDSCTVFAFSC